MAVTWVRNCLSPFTQDARGCNHVILISELLRVAGYTYNSDDGDPNWAANELVDEPGGANGFQVQAAAPRVIYDPLGRFTAAMAGTDSDGACIALRATNEANRSVWKITEYIDANHVKIDEKGVNPDAWVDESGIPGRIFTQNAGVFGNDSWVLLDAPSPSKLQARINYTTSSWIDLFVRPAGQDGDPTEAGSGSQVALDNYYTNRVRANLYADGANVFIYWIDQDGSADVMGWGELEVADPTKDLYPGFVLWHDDMQGNSAHRYDLRMLDTTGSSITCYIDYLKRTWDTTEDGRVDTKFTARLVNNGFAMLRKPNVVMWGPDKYPRGKLPDFFVQTYDGWEAERPLDRAGNWFHWFKGCAVRRNGPDDPLLVRPPTS